VIWQDPLKAGFVLGSLVLFTRELARSSVILTVDDIKHGKLPGDHLLLLWPYTENSNEGLFTIIEDDLVERLATTSAELRNRLRAAYGSSYAGRVSDACLLGGWKPTYWADIPTPSDTVSIASGKRVMLINPPSGPTHGLTLLLRSAASGTYITPFPSINVPVGGDNPALINYSNNLDSSVEYYPCFKAGLTKGMKDEINFLNSGPTSVWFFQSMLLQAFWTEFGGTVSQRSMQLASLETNLKQLSGYKGDETATSWTTIARKYFGALDCVKECAQQTPNCGNLVYDNPERRKALQRLYLEFRKPQPFVITPQHLGEIFGMTGDPMLNLRQSTQVQLGEVTNDGKPSTITAKTGDLTAWLNVPHLLIGKLTVETSDVIVEFPIDGSRASLTLSDLIVNQQFGGDIWSINGSEDRLLFLMPNGCLKVPLKTMPQQRKSMVGSLMTLHFPGNEGGGGEQTCKTASAVVGYPCPIGNCPSSGCENFTVTCNDNQGSANYCVTVTAGCGQTGAAITAAENAGIPGQTTCH
jgi:hypothetical protein